MKPLIVLLAVFATSLFVFKISTGEFDYPLSGRIAMSAMLLFTSIAHFAFTKGMTMMMPDFIHFKKQLVYITGFLEIAAAIGLLIPGWKIMTGWTLILFFIMLVPANINAALKRIDYQKGTYDGSGANYLWFRIPLQILFIAWVYVCAIKF